MEESNENDLKHNNIGIVNVSLDINSYQHCLFSMSASPPQLEFFRVFSVQVIAQFNVTQSLVLYTRYINDAGCTLLKTVKTMFVQKQIQGLLLPKHGGCIFKQSMLSTGNQFATSNFSSMQQKNWILLQLSFFHAHGCQTGQKN